MASFKRSRCVQFSFVEIIELPYTLGDNPSVSGGPPVAASWQSQKRTSLDLEFFELYRPPRRNKSALHLSKEARKELMLQNGHTESEIHLATVQAAKTRQERLATIHEIRQKVKALIAVGKAYNNGDTICNGAVSSRMPHHSQQLPPSPIVPQKSPARTAHFHNENFAHLRFPISDSILSPRGCSRRKRPAPVNLGEDLFHDDALTPHIYNSTPKRIRSPRNKTYVKPTLSPRQENICFSMRFPARIKSPIADSRPLLKPRRLASPPPSMLYQKSPQPRAI